MYRTLLSLALVVVCSTAALAQNAESKNPALEAKVRELLALTGSADMATQMIDQMIPAMKEMAPGVPESLWTELASEMSVDGLIEELIPIYMKEYTEREIDAMLTFYRTPEGQSVIKKMPSVMTQSMLVGQQWGQKAAQRVFERLQEKGYAPKS
jgi:uncharacterized protein